MASGIPARLSPAEGRKFGLLVGVAFVVLAGLMWRRSHVTAAWVAAGLGCALLVSGLVMPARLGPVYRGWMALAGVISKVTTPVFMSILFFVVLTPAGVLARLLGHRPLSRPRGTGTYWQSRQPGDRQGQLDHQF